MLTRSCPDAVSAIACSFCVGGIFPRYPVAAAAGVSGVGAILLVHWWRLLLIKSTANYTHNITQHQTFQFPDFDKKKRKISILQLLYII